MASSSCLRAAARSPLRSHLLRAKSTSSTPLRRGPASYAPPRRRHALSSGSAVEVARCCSLGLLSLFPLHSVVAAARMTSRLSSSTCRSSSCKALSQGTLCRTSPGL